MVSSPRPARAVFMIFMICDRRLKHYLSLSRMDEMAFLLDKMIGAFEEIL